VAGDPERASRRRRELEGIEIPAATWQDLGTLAARYGVPLP
jgi:LDH2 family malate/lactate/ureidoglycolate dehydrogenase